MDPRDLLHKHFGFRDFLEGQETVVRAVLERQDVVVIMPTGGGKSLCYQLPALALQGITVVVSPLIALMKDQVDSLVEKEIPATFINSSITPDEAAERMHRVTRGGNPAFVCGSGTFQERSVSAPTGTSVRSPVRCGRGALSLTVGP